MIKCLITFDKSKEVKYLKKSQISRVLECKNFKEIKHLKSLQVKAEAYLESKRAPTMGLFVNILSGLLFLQ